MVVIVVSFVIVGRWYSSPSAPAAKPTGAPHQLRFDRFRVPRPEALTFILMPGNQDFVLFYHHSPREGLEKKLLTTFSHFHPHPLLLKIRQNRRQNNRYPPQRLAIDKVQEKGLPNCEREAMPGA